MKLCIIFLSKGISPLTALLALLSMYCSLLAEAKIVAYDFAESELNVSTLRGLSSAKSSDDSQNSIGQRKGDVGNPMDKAIDLTNTLGKKERRPIDRPTQTIDSTLMYASKNLTGTLKTMITTQTNTFSATDPVAINFTIVNEGENTARILKWFIPKHSIAADVLQENAFSVKYVSSSMNSQQGSAQSISQTNGRLRLPGAYVGAHHKRLSMML